MRKLLAAVSAGIVGGALALSAPAQAIWNCTPDALCFYDTNTSTYPFIDHDDADNSPGECHVMPASQRFKASYVENQTDHVWYWYRTLNCSGYAGPMYAYTNGAIASNQAAAYRRAG